MISQSAILGQASGLGVIGNYLDWVVAGAIVVLGLLVYGARDVLRICFIRIRAVASVCFRESIRRRVLWLTPLAIIGVLVVAQFQRPLDEQDAIRQVTKFCIFASGILITLSTVILACTNLPREIDNRVIYTVVTKPASRLEILLGKIFGFSVVSAVILLIMGVFSYGYLRFHEWRVMGEIDVRLAAGGLEPSTESTLQYYQKNGLLDARRYVSTNQVQVFAEYPDKDSDVRLIEGPSQQAALIPFAIGTDILPEGSSFGGLAVVMRLPWQQRPLSNDELLNVLSIAEQAGIRNDIPTPAGPQVEGTEPTTDVSKLLPAFFNISFLSERMESLLEPHHINNGIPHAAFDAEGNQTITIPLPPDAAEHLVNNRRFYLRIAGNSPGTKYVVDPDNFAIVLAMPNGQVAVRSQKLDERMPPLLIMGRVNQNGQQLGGKKEGTGAVGVFAFEWPAMNINTGQADFEFRTIVERDADDIRDPTFAQFRIVNNLTGMVSDPVTVPVESRRTAHFSFPSEYVQGGDFEVLVQLLNDGQWLSLRPGALRISSESHSFGFNLFKSFFILWLYSVLVVVVAIFCSTFLSWPIAFVLTLLILLGHWGVLQLGDLASPGVGRQIVSDLFSGAAPAVAETLNRSVEGLSALLRLVASVLPDISQFAAMSDIEQGLAISVNRLLDALKVLAIFGLSFLTFSYVFFRNKEVAP